MTRPLSDEEAERAEDLFGPLTDSLRKLIDVAIRSEVTDTDVTRAHALIDRAVDLLAAQADPNPSGMRTTTAGRTLTWGNIAIGMRNAIAPPLVVRIDDTGRASTDLTLGAPYEGPPGQVHGGMCALVLDHVLGATAHRPGRPAFTGTLTLRYVAPTPLGRVRAEAWIDTETNSKTIAAGHIKDANGLVTVRAEGVFIRPKAVS